MFTVKSAVLAAALAGRTLPVAAQTGCYPTYSSGASYTSGSLVSASTSTETQTTASCTPGAVVAGAGTCPSTGQITTTTTTVTTTNYQCVDNMNSAFCGQSAYEPTGIAGGIAWTPLTECSGSAPAAATTPGPSPALWSGGGCPAIYSAGAGYEEGDLVTVVGTSFSTVYRCNDGASAQWCNLPGYEPGTSLYWTQAWTALGSCTGTIAPTGSPVYVALADAGGCPAEFSASETYEEGDKISRDGLVYQCNSFPQSLHCSQVGFEPGECIAADTCYWKQAWSVTGFCSGTIAPTTSPNYVSLQDMGGCPESWSAQVYEEGDRVSDGSLVYQCKAWPFSGHCGQAGYEPNVDPATPGAWKDAWTVMGFCSGTIAPTTSPNFDPATVVGACPDEWTQGSNVAYEEGDMVSVTVSAVPLRKVAYRCKAWPFSGFCGQLSPTVFGGNQGWTLVGSCDGSVGPTSAPSFDSLKDTNMGCPAPWNAGFTEYEAGDMVSYAVSNAPERKIVFACREWPNTGYCNQGTGFEPTTQYANLAWEIKGYCDGTLAPTASPVVFTPSAPCTFSKCLMVDVTSTVPTCNGISNCVCTGTPQVCTKTTSQQDCTNQVAVQPWSASGITGASPAGLNGQYEAGDVVRLGAQRYKCRQWPNELYCQQSVRQPTRETNGLWTSAWMLDGVCT